MANPAKYSPKAFLKKRRPERFSDSEVEESRSLDRSLLEFHLASVTTHKQETDFERFARRLAERELCPNLLPQTGPTGGGDSGVDSETIPVADIIAATWWSGIGREASQERWAFAFSAKKDWRGKVKSDIAKLAATARGYRRAFFITNQAVPDRKRAELEDSLGKEHGLQVAILDRTWILDCVFRDRLESLAIEELRISGINRSTRRVGPVDARREKEALELEDRICELANARQFSPALVDEALRAADVARQLERPRSEVEGKYSRAVKLAEEYGTPRQRIECRYQWAWTLYWWFEDFLAFADEYDRLEEAVEGSRNAYDLEELTTLWQLLHSAARSGAPARDVARVLEHSGRLLKELDRLALEVDRPSTSLQAETLRLQVQLLIKTGRNKSTDDVLVALRDVVLRSEGLVGYPLQPLIDILSEIGPAFEGASSYNDLFATIVEVSAKRNGEIAAARLLLRRGQSQLEGGRSIEAIATLGLCLGRLHKHETRVEIVQALYLCGCALDQAGLPWAARGTLLHAASIATNEYWTAGEITRAQAACYRRLKWVELELGRLPHLLAWHRLDLVVRQALAGRGFETPEASAHGDASFDLLLGRLLLGTDFDDLKALRRLPDTLDHLGLEMSATALLFALGYDHRLKDAASAWNEEMETAASRWRTVRTDRLVAQQPLLYNGDRVALSAHILGCHIRVYSDSESPCVEVAESFLAALESLLATGVLNHGFAREPTLTVDVNPASGPGSLISSEIEERGGRPHLTIHCAHFHPHDLSVEQQRLAREAIFEAVSSAVAHTILFSDFERDIVGMLHGERAADRALAFTSTLGAQANVLGKEPDTRLDSWVRQSKTDFPPQRPQPWQPTGTGLGVSHGVAPEFTQLEPPAELFDPNRQTHDRLRTISLIREPLWNRARWTGALFLTFEDADGPTPPIMALIFRDLDAGRAIFRLWREELGTVDRDEQLRIAVVRGIDKESPYAYRMMVGSSPSELAPESYYLLINRIHRMDATTGINLERFLNAYKSAGFFYLAPAFAPPGFDGSQPPREDLDLTIAVHRVHVRNAWEIGVHDIDAMGILAGDDPIVPHGVDRPPVAELLNARASAK